MDKTINSKRTSIELSRRSMVSALEHLIGLEKVVSVQINMDHEIASIKVDFPEQKYDPNAVVFSKQEMGLLSRILKAQTTGGKMLDQKSRILDKEELNEMKLDWRVRVAAEQMLGKIGAREFFNKLTREY